MFIVHIDGKICNNKHPQSTSNMSGKSGKGVIKLDQLKLTLSPPTRINTDDNPYVGTPSRSATVSPTSPPSSCISSELNQDHSSPETTSSMILVGCPRCLMYLMLPEDEYPTCPKCNTTALLDVLAASKFVHHHQ